MDAPNRVGRVLRIMPSGEVSVVVTIDGGAPRDIAVSAARVVWTDSTLGTVSELMLR